VVAAYKNFTIISDKSHIPTKQTCENIRTLESRSFNLGSSLSKRTILPANEIIKTKHMVY
jgi:hypothetical protein